MKLTPYQKKYNLSITKLPPKEEKIDRDSFYGQFDTCPECGGLPTGPLTESNTDDIFSGNKIQHRSCNPCNIKWTYIEYAKIENDPAYQAYLRSTKRPEIVIQNEDTPTNRKWLIGVVLVVLLFIVIGVFL